MRAKWGVVIIDVQGDFTEWKRGSLAVPGSDEDYVKSAERAARQLGELGLGIFATQDWHPPDHVSFAANHPGRKPLETVTLGGETQALWPSHCIQGTENARILIDNSLFLAVVKKGQHPASESYSGFQDNRGIKTEMDTILQANGIGKVIVYGLATDYCVKATSLDLNAAGYLTTVIEGLCRCVSTDTASAALDEMRLNGVRVVPSVEEIIEEIRRDVSKG